MSRYLTLFYKYKQKNTMTHLKGYFEMSNYDNCNKPSISVSQNKHMLGPRSIGLNHTERSNTKNQLTASQKYCFSFLKIHNNFLTKSPEPLKKFELVSCQFVGNPPPPNKSCKTLQKFYLGMCYHF